jgi:hypothetical protein
VAVSCEHSNEPSGSIKSAEFHDGSYLIKKELIKLVCFGFWGTCSQYGVSCAPRSAVCYSSVVTHEKVQNGDFSQRELSCCALWIMILYFSDIKGGCLRTGCCREYLD